MAAADTTSARPMLAGHPFTFAVASGKGGTGKTLVATSAAVLLAQDGREVVLVDCDVEAPNDHLFLSRSRETVSQVEVPIAEADPVLCTACGACRDVCAFGAVRILGSSAIVFDELCHGCGLCSGVCPTGAMHEVARRVGEVVAGPVDGRQNLTLVSGRLDVGQVKTPSVINAARGAARARVADVIVLDAPPGVACAAVAAVREVDALLLVTEPTPFGIHDLELSVRLGRSMGTPVYCVVNRDDGASRAVDEACAAWGVGVVGRIPFDREIARTYATGGLVVDSMPAVGEVLREAVRHVVAAESAGLGAGLGAVT